MKYVTTVRHQAILKVDGEPYTVTFEEDGDIAMYINGSYIDDFEAIPCADKVLDLVRQYIHLEEMASEPGIRSFRW